MGATKSTATLTVTLSSGAKIGIDKIALFDEVELASIAKTRAEAARHLGGSGAMAGVFGTPSFALAAEAGVLMLAGGLFASAAQRAAIENLQQAQLKLNELKLNPEHFSVGEIAGIASPDPAQWRGSRNNVLQRVNLSKMGRYEREIFLEKHGKTMADVEAWHVEVTLPKGYIHTGEDFVQVITGTDTLFIRWSTVVSCHCTG